MFKKNNKYTDEYSDKTSLLKDFNSNEKEERRRESTSSKDYKSIFTWLKKTNKYGKMKDGQAS